MKSEIFDQKYKQLNIKQKEAVDTIFGPVMVLAGPGTGKTTVLTLRIANILKQTDAKPDEILALTFTDSGVKAMREKLREIIGDASFRVNIFTFHSFANYMRSLYPEYFTRIGGRIPCSEIDQVEIIEEILNEESFEELRISTYGINIKSICKRIGDLKRELITKDALNKFIIFEEQELEDTISAEKKKTKTFEKSIESKRKYITRMKEFSRTFGLYEEKLIKRGIYDFDDTVLGLIEALEEHPDMAVEMRENFQFILADEHQDANGSQNQILKFFNDKGAFDPPNIFVVGDDKQSIFRFQGANLENFFAFEKEFKSAKKIDLEENYRSHSFILNASHSLISNDGRKHTKLSSNVKHTEKPIEILEFDSERAELEKTAQNIKDLLKDNKEDNIAVLSRNNTTLFRLAPFLDVLGVPYNLKGELSLFETLEYKKIYSLLVALDNPLGTGELLKSVLFGFFDSNIKDVFYIQDEAIKKRKNFANLFLGKLESFDLDQKEKMVKLQKDILYLISESKKKPLLEFLKILRERIILSDKSELFEVLKLLFLEAEKLVLKKRNSLLSDFVEHLNRIDTHGVLPLAQLEEREARVTLSSIHKSKGLEYDFVYILSVTSKTFEELSKKSDLLRIPGIGVSKDIAEERRLLYVALTRAKKHATLSFSMLNADDGSQVPSILLDEIDKELVSRQRIDYKPYQIDLLSHKKDTENDLKKILHERFLKRNFSVTALNNYINCPYKYIFRNLLLVPDIKEFSALLGTACHEVLRRFHLLKKKGETVSKEMIDKFIEEEVERQPFSKNELNLALKKVKENISAFMKSWSEFSKDSDVFIEESLSFPFTFESGKENVEIILNGKIDLATRSGNTVSVVDFKSKQKMSANAIKGETKSSTGDEYRQLQFYKLLWQGAKPEDAVTTGSLVFLTPDAGEVSKVDFELKESDLNFIKEVVSKVLLEIYTGEFLDKRCGDEKCEYCRSGLI